jgi:hypothetical protein
MAGALSRHGLGEPEIVRLYRTFNAAAKAFRAESERHDRAVGAAEGSTP